MRDDGTKILRGYTSRERACIKHFTPSIKIGDYKKLQSLNELRANSSTLQVISIDKFGSQIVQINCSRIAVG